MAGEQSPIPVEQIGRTILLIRGQKVMLDSALAELYGVTTKRLNEQVKRNRRRFPDDFMFQLNLQEHRDLRSQFATSNRRHGGRRYLPMPSQSTGRSWQRTSLIHNEPSQLVCMLSAPSFACES